MFLKRVNPVSSHSTKKAANTIELCRKNTPCWFVSCDIMWRDSFHRHLFIDPHPRVVESIKNYIDNRCFVILFYMPQPIFSLETLFLLYWLEFACCGGIGWKSIDTMWNEPIEGRAERCVDKKRAMTIFRVSFFRVLLIFVGWKP